MKVRLTQIDGKLPNLALMKLAYWHKSKGDEVFFESSINKSMFEPDYDIVYGSAIFSSSEKKIELFKIQFPSAIIGGTGYDMTINNLKGLESLDIESIANELNKSAVLDLVGGAVSAGVIKVGGKIIELLK